MLTGKIHNMHWKQGSHPYQEDQFLQVKSIPTLLLCKGNEILLRADTPEQFANVAYMDRFLTTVPVSLKQKKLIKPCSILAYKKMLQGRYI